MNRSPSYSASRLIHTKQLNSKRSRLACDRYWLHSSQSRPPCSYFAARGCLMPNWLLRSILTLLRSAPCSPELDTLSKRSTSYVMENKIKLDTERWVEERMALLAAPQDWEPDAGVARARLQGRLSARRPTPARIWLPRAAVV